MTRESFKDIVGNELARKILKETLNASELSERVGLQRAKKLENLLYISKEFSPKKEADLGFAMRTLLLSDQALFQDFAHEMKMEDGDDQMERTYERMANNGTFHAFKNVQTLDNATRANQITSTAGDGGNDFATLFVEKNIVKRSETKNNLLSYLDRKPNNATEGKYPKSSNTAAAAFANDGDNLVDITNTVDSGFDNTLLQVQKFGALMNFYRSAYSKLDAAHLRQIMTELTDAYSRGMTLQIISGDGNSPNATGFATNATSVTWQGNVVSTLFEMIKQVTYANRGTTQDVFIVMNSSGAINLLGESLINTEYGKAIQLNMGGSKDGKFMGVFPVVEVNEVLNTGSSPTQVSPFYVGIRKHYLYVKKSDPQIKLNEFSGFESASVKARIVSDWSGKPHWNDSFAKSGIIDAM